MPLADVQHNRISSTVDVPAAVVYALFADIPAWPTLFPWILHTRWLARDGAKSRFRCWALRPDGTVRTWATRVELDPGSLEVRFEQEEAVDEVGKLTGRWSFRPLADRRTEIRSEQSFRLAEDDAGLRDRVLGILRRQSRRQLDALAERSARRAEFEALTLTFEDSLTIRGTAASARQVVDAVREWPARVAHVERVAQTWKNPETSLVELDVHDSGGYPGARRMAWISLPEPEIVYRQLALPSTVAQHIGRWQFAELPHGVAVTARQTVVFATRLANKRELAVARGRLRAELGAEAADILRAVKEEVEGPR
ncbi:SRPBCC family protein [Amycolatopsis sp. NPDC003676]